MAHRVVVWGPGNVGIPAIRTVLAHPELELAGVLVNSESKVGVDAGELAGVGAVGVAATRDVDAVLGARPDAVVYAANQDFRPVEAQDDMVRALEAGANVVTAGLYGLLHPPSADPALRGRFEAACRKGDSSFLSSGIDPGFALDLLPIVMSGVCAEIREVRVVENFNYETYHEHVPDAVKAIMGFGSAMDQTPMMILPGIPQTVWGPALRGLAEALGVEVDEIREVVERHPLERDVTLSGGDHFAAGTLGAFRFEVQAIVEGRPVLILEHVTRIVDDTAPQWPRANGMGYHQVRISGYPRITLTLESEDEHGDHVAGGNTTAAARIVHAIPWLCQAPAGLAAGTDLPLVSGRGLVRA